MDINHLISDCANWFQRQNIDRAVVGYSGGIDSAVTSALLSQCGIEVHIAVVEAPNQKYSSSMGGYQGAKEFVKAARLKAVVHKLFYDFMFSDDAANEAAAPIQRVAGFYGICAGLRADGKSAVVAGTANFDEAGYLGFWGKASDAAQDIYPISHLHKSEVYDLAKLLSIPFDIQNAVPSGDLLFRRTCDLEMIGATYSQIESIARSIEKGVSEEELHLLLTSVEVPKEFCNQIISNKFKYALPFGGFHLSDRLELFRKNYYHRILQTAETWAVSSEPS